MGSKDRLPFGGYGSGHVFLPSGMSVAIDVGMSGGFVVTACMAEQKRMRVNPGTGHGNRRRRGRFRRWLIRRENQLIDPGTILSDADGLVFVVLPSQDMRALAKQTRNLSPA